MYKNREFLALFILFLVVFILVSIITEQPLRAFNVEEIVPRIYVVMPGDEAETDAPGSSVDIRIAGSLDKGSVAEVK